MIAFLAVMLLVAAAAILMVLVAALNWEVRAHSDWLSDADRQLTAAMHAARRAMNDAAGQSWRNLAD